jgi:xylose isomerase
MYTIQQIEELDLSKLNRKDLSKLKQDLTVSFYYTSHTEVSSDGSNLKDRIGNQLTRITMYIMERKSK